jgi:Flp pilus assembly protein TadG
MVEFAIAFPLQLLIMFAIMQLAMVYVAKQVVTYASYSAERAALVADSPEDAYRRASLAGALICSPITGPTVEGSNFSESELRSGGAMMWAPGWGLLSKSGISRRLKTHVSRLDYPAPGEVEVTVTHYYEMTLPLVNHIFAWLARGSRVEEMPDATGPLGTVARGDECAFEESVGIWNINAPHMRLRETTRLAIPGGRSVVED